MSEQGSRRPLLFALTGLAATLILAFAYQKYNQEPTSSSSGLRRTNAIRRSRHRWRRGFPPRELDYNPVVRAVDHLNRRISLGLPYGRYHTQHLFGEDAATTENETFDLLPSNLLHIYNTLRVNRSVGPSEERQLHSDIHTSFVQCFLEREIPRGFIIEERGIEILVEQLSRSGVDEDVARECINFFNLGVPPPRRWDSSTGHDQTQPSGAVPTEGSVNHISSQNNVTAQDAIEALAGPSAGDASDSDDDSESDPGGSQNMLDLLYHIASEQARREGFVHRDVQCNGCGIKPVQGIRYHCANCFDYDLCEDCEAQQMHNKSHVFYKIRIPAPPRGHLKHVAPVWYPGNPNAFPNTMPHELQQNLLEEYGMDKTEMEASYEQFKCLAGHQIPIESDPAHLGMAISRKNFDMFFTPTSADRPPPPNLIYDRIFAFYDLNGDGFITLEEYIVGISEIMDKSRGARLKRLFMGYDLDEDGFVDRKDFLRMFRAYFALNKELNKEMTVLQDDLDDDIRDVVQGSQPISAAFSGHYFAGHASRGGQDKAITGDGDYVITTGPNGVLQNDTEMRGDRSRAIGNAAVRDRIRTHPFRSFRQQPESDEQLLFLPFTSLDRGESNIPLAEDIDDEELTGPDPALHVYGWPPQQMPETQDIVNALGVDIPVEDVTDPIDRSRVIYAQVQRLDEESDKTLNAERAAAIRDRWRRRQFYLDKEEGLSQPPGYTEPDSSDGEAASIDEPTEPVSQMPANSRRQSMRSRSSSKVRFDDSAIDTDYETRSNTSSRSIPVNERWGGFELGEPERDVGREILYQAVQQGFNELLDPLFKKKEDDAIVAIATRGHRIKWKAVLDEYEEFRRKNKKKKDKGKSKKEEVSEFCCALFANEADKSSEPGTGIDDPHSMLSDINYDETDHINIMFGNSMAVTQEAVQFSPDTKTGDPKSESYVDPTLPQNKPNHPDFEAFNSTTNDSNITSLTPAPSKRTLKTWLRHRKIDEEAKLRGSYGKLSYREFRRLMVQEADRDSVFGESSKEAEKAQSGKENKDTTTPSMTDNHEPDDEDAATAALSDSSSDTYLDSGDDNDDKDEKWTSDTSLGRMSFCGAWLEMAQF